MVVFFGISFEAKWELHCLSVPFVINKPSTRVTPIRYLLIAY